MEVLNISPTNNFSFNGLGRHYKKDLFTDKTLDMLQNLYPKSNGIVGNLPDVWVKNMPEASRKECIKGLYSELGQLSKYLKALSEDNSLKIHGYLFDKISEYCGKKPSAGKYLTYILKKYNAIGKDEKVAISHLRGGAFGDGFKLENKTTNEKLFLKVFNDYAFETDWLGQGTKKEINNNIYIRNNLKSKSEKKLFPKFYFADTINGYYISEFLPTENSILVLSKEEIKDLDKIIKSALDKQELMPTDILCSNYKVYKTPDGKLTPVYFDLGGIIKKSFYEKIHKKNKNFIFLN